jgi:hypothetical protein
MKLFFAVQNIIEPDYGYSYIKERPEQTKLFGKHLYHTHQSLWYKIILWKLKQTNQVVLDKYSSDACVVVENDRCTDLNPCGNKPTVRIGAADDDLIHGPMARLKVNCQCSYNVLRVVGNRRYLLTAEKKCNNQTIDIPFASHIHSWIPESFSFERPHKLFIAANWRTHFQSRNYGFDIWRKDILKYCQSNVDCKHIIPGGRGYNMPEIAVMYSKSVFCINPPGDTLVRSAIIDSVALGCIPVFLHSQQSNLWNNFWTSRDCAINLSWELKNKSEQISSLDSLYHLTDIKQRRKNCILQSNYLIYNKHAGFDAVYKLNNIIQNHVARLTVDSIS